jgi:hypothetical protein
MKQLPDVIPGGNRAVRRWLAVLAASVCLAGCAVTAASYRTAFQGDTNTAAPALPDIDHVGLFVDGAVEYTDMSDNFVDIADSRVAVATIADKTNAELARIGVAVDFTATPFVGGMIGQTPLPAAANRDAKPAPMTPPFDAQGAGDPADQTALQDVSRGVARAFAEPALLTNAGGWSPAARDGLAAIAAEKHVRYLLVVQGVGHIESGLRQTVEGVGTAALTAALSLGKVAVSVRNVSWLNSYVMLIDLETGNVVWSNSVLLKNFNPGEPDDYVRKFWSGRVLYRLPGRAKRAPG